MPGAQLTIVKNDSPCAQHSLAVDVEHAYAVAQFLRDDPQLRLDYCSNVTGVDYLDAELSEKVKVKKTQRAGYLEAVYHLYSMSLKHGPVILRQRTPGRADPVRVTSLTPLWRSAEFQEREVFDLYGVLFDGHPDLRRILMWDGFKDYPMRKDYVEPDDYEYEPTPHDEVLEKAKAHQPTQEAKA